MKAALPKGFEPLEPFVERFALEGTANRARLRSESSAEERVAFHQAAKDHIAAALDFLDRKPVDELEGPEQTLMNLVLAYAHIALAVELQGPDEAHHAAMREHMRITRSPADAVA